MNHTAFCCLALTCTLHSCAWSSTWVVAIGPIFSLTFCSAICSHSSSGSMMVKCSSSLAAASSIACFLSLICVIKNQIMIAYYVNKAKELYCWHHFKHRGLRTSRVYLERFKWHLFSCLQLFKHIVLNLTSIAGWCPTDL